MEQTLRPPLKPLTTRRPARRIAVLLCLTGLTLLIGYRGRALSAAENPALPEPAEPAITRPAATPAQPTAPESQPTPEEDPTAAEPTLLDQAVAFIEPFEGRRRRAYRDSRGNMTIGVGFNLDRPGAAEDLAELLPHVGYHALRIGERSLTDSQIDTLLRHDTRRAINTARRQVQDFDALPLDAKLIVIDMTFNTGSLHKWSRFRSALARQDYAAAADAMHRSLWRRQTGRRAEHLITSMRELAEG